LSDNVEDDEFMLLHKDTLDFNMPNPLEGKYILRDDWRDISDFLEKNPLLPSVLMEAHSQLMKYFPNNPKVFLSLGMAPEDMSVDHLIASVASGLDVDTAVDTLFAFDEEWWLARLGQTQAKLSITVE
jgi:hypothetical protein